MLRQNVNFRFGGPVTETVKKLMILNGAVFLLQQITGMFVPGGIERLFGLSHTGLIYEFKIWQIFTYMFLHGNLLHLLFNLLALWMFAGELEQMWGSKTFLQYYIFSGIGAGFFIAVMNFIVYSKYGYAPLTIGASGAIYGILLAYGITWPDREVLLYFIMPIKIKYLVLAFGLLEFFGTISSAMGSGGNISHIGHLGGLVTGFLYILFKGRKPHIVKKTSPGSMNFITGYLKRKKLERKKIRIDKRIKAKVIIDELLEKIARHGMSSLTSSEKKNLEWARKHYYPNDEDVVH